MKLLSIMTIGLLLLTGCECWSEYKLEVLNNTQQEVVFKYARFGESHSLPLLPGERKELFVDHGHRCACNHCEARRYDASDGSMTRFMTEIEVSKDSMLSTANYNKEYNWNFESHNGLGLYVAKIEENDF